MKQGALHSAAAAAKVHAFSARSGSRARGSQARPVAEMTGFVDGSHLYRVFRSTPDALPGDTGSNPHRLAWKQSTASMRHDSRPLRSLARTNEAGPGTGTRAGMSNLMSHA